MRKHPLSISDAEWKIMEILWQENPLSVSEVVERLPTDLGWSPNTVRTMLARLCKKDFVDWTRRHSRYAFKPLISREEYVDQEGRRFLARAFGGRSASLLLHFARSANFTAEEAEILRAVLNEKGDHE